MRKGKQGKPVIAVAGAGRMGTGIAQAFASMGYRVELIDMKRRSGEEARKVLGSAVEEIAGNLEFLASLGVLKGEIVGRILERIHCHDVVNAGSALREAEVVFEAVPEVMDIKEEALNFISSCAGNDALIASTTSTFLADTLASRVSRPERFMNTHWLNPAYLIPLVEVSPGRKTAPGAVQKMISLLESAGKVPVKCSPSPGFIVPRIQALAMNEAARLVEEGVASPEDVDKASRLGFGIRFAVMGMLEFIDWGGGDILFYASNYLRDSMKAGRFSPPAVISENMERGRIGIKSGRGFYDYSGMDVSEYRKETVRKFVDLLRHLNLLPPFPEEDDFE